VTTKLSSWSYDLIAEVYDTDMGSNLPHDDRKFYVDLCKEVGGLVLELGCGTGRVLLAMAAAGYDVVGADVSLPMLTVLRRIAAERGLRAAVIQADACLLPFKGIFNAVLAPFSVVTYAVDRDALHRFFTSARNALRPGGMFVVDAFVPRDISGWREFRQDYVRPHAHGLLERRRRITPLANGVNRIERQYRLTLETAVQREWTTIDVIRPYHCAELRFAAMNCGLQFSNSFLDYGDSLVLGDAQFETLVFVLPAG
jgi:SAM-dependent methyltransferase